MKIDYDKLIVGSTVESVVFAYQNQILLLLIDTKPPLISEHFKNNQNKLDLWNSHIRELSLSGLLPFSNLIEKLTFEKDHLECLTINKNRHQIYYKKLYVATDSILNLRIKTVHKINSDIQIHDVFLVENLTNEAANNYKDSINIMDNKIKGYFKKIVGHGGLYLDTILVVEEEEKDLFEYSEVNIRLLLEQELKIIFKKSISLKHVKRSARKDDHFINEYKPIKNVEFLYELESLIG